MPHFTHLQAVPAPHLSPGLRKVRVRGARARGSACVRRCARTFALGTILAIARAVGRLFFGLCSQATSTQSHARHFLVKRVTTRATSKLPLNLTTHPIRARVRAREHGLQHRLLQNPARRKQDRGQPGPHSHSAEACRAPVAARAPPAPRSPPRPAAAPAPVNCMCIRVRGREGAGHAHGRTGQRSRSPRRQNIPGREQMGTRDRSREPEFKRAGRAQDKETGSQEGSILHSRLRPPSLPLMRHTLSPSPAPPPTHVDICKSVTCTAASAGCLPMAATTAPTPPSLRAATAASCRGTGCEDQCFAATRSAQSSAHGTISSERGQPPPFHILPRHHDVRLVLRALCGFVRARHGALCHDLAPPKHPASH